MGEHAEKIANAAQAVGNVGVVGALYGGFTATELAAFGGLALAFLGYLTNAAITFYFKLEHLKLAKESVRRGEAVEGDE